MILGVPNRNPALPAPPFGGRLAPFPELLRGGVKSVPIIADALDQIAGLLSREAMLGREIVHFVALALRDATPITAAPLPLVVCN